MALNASPISTWKYSSPLVRQRVSRGLGIAVEQERSRWKQLVKTLANSLAHTQRRWTSPETSRHWLRGTGKSTPLGQGGPFSQVSLSELWIPGTCGNVRGWGACFTGLAFYNSSETFWGRGSDWCSYVISSLVFPTQVITKCWSPD